MERERTELRGFMPIVLLIMVLIALFVVVPTKAYADPEGGVGYTIAQTFTDPNMASAVATQLGTTTDHIITTYDITSTTTCYFPQKGITNIEGIEYFTNLNYFELEGNQISDISPLSGLTNLTRLDLEDNQISDLSSLSGLTNLTELYLNNNQVSDISPLSELTGLTELGLDDNQISDISPLSGLTNLEWLYLHQNLISDITSLFGLTNLTGLDLRDNQISDISPLSGLTNLTEIDLSDNQIRDISPLSGLLHLDYADATGQVVTLSDAIGSTTGSFDLQNPLIGIDGSPVAIDSSSITPSGTYTSPILSWTGLPIGKTLLSFSTSEEVPNIPKDVPMVGNGQSIVSFSAQVSETVTIPRPTVSYASNGSDGGSLPAQVAYTIGDTVSIDFTTLPTKTGYTFSGWSDGTTTYSSNGTTSFTMSTGDVTLTAVWTQDAVADNGNSSSTPDASTYVVPKTGDISNVLAATTAVGFLGMMMVGLSFYKRNRE